MEEVICVFFSASVFLFSVLSVLLHVGTHFLQCIFTYQLYGEDVLHAVWTHYFQHHVL